MGRAGEVGKGGRRQVWTKLLEKHARITESELRECAELMVGFHRRAAEGSLTAVHKKYSLAKFCNVAGVPPATLPLLPLSPPHNTI